MLDLSRVEYRPYYLVNAIEVNGGPFLRAYLSSRPEVDRILDSQHLRPLPAPVPVSSGDTSAPSEPPWNITSIGADRVWKELGITGKGIVVGQSDSGVQGGNSFKDGDPTRAAHVINNSWGCPPIEGCDTNALAPAVSALRAAGIFVVASAGNEGPRCSSVSDPIAIYDAAFSVGALDRFGSLAPFSSRGPVTVDGSQRVKPDIVAPGVDVLSSMPKNTFAPNSGTSMAGPHVVGVVALMWSAQPKLIGNIDRTEQILIETARPYTGTLDQCAGRGRPDNDVGYGLVDAYAAVKAALAE